MDAASINFGALCKCSPSGDVISVAITADEYAYLCDLTNRTNEIVGYCDDFKYLDYPDFLDLVAKAQVVEWNKGSKK